MLAAPRAVRAAGTSPLDWSLGAGQITSSCARALSTANARIRAIGAARGKRTFENTVLALENATADLNDALAAQLFLFNVSTAKSVRDASLACQTRVSDQLAALTARPDLYRALAAAARSRTAKGIYQHKLTALWLVALRRSGAGLRPTRRVELLRLERELTDLQNRFLQNLAEDATTVVVERRDLAGLPADVLATYRRNRDGSYTVPVNEGTLSFLQDARSQRARRVYYMAYENRAAAANVPIFERALAVRDRIAHLLGYESWAAYQLADRMAGSLARVDAFLKTTSAAIRPAAQSELLAMRNALDAERHTPGAALQPWDVQRAEYLVGKANAVDQNAVRQYFPVQHTIDAVLDLYHTLLGVNFSQVVPADAWAPDVLEYRVTDRASGKLLGLTYFDLYPRPGKFGHFANFPILPVRTIGAARVPIAAIVGNWPKPAPGEPALLSHADVVAFFHEFGHDMAALLATAPYETLSDGFREDFVEAPSQMLENFAWQPEILKRITSNQQTGAPMPDAMIAQLAASRESADAYDTLRLLTIATIDMQYHSMGPHVDTTALWAKTAATMLPLLYEPGTHPQVAFGHMMSGYDAGLYAYPWAKVYAQDLFTAFAGDHLLDPAVGMRYRRDILAPARTYEPAQEVRAFLGRPMNPAAFYAEFGVAPAATVPAKSPAGP